MKRKEAATTKTSVLIVVVPVLFILLPLGYNVVHYVLAKPPATAQPFVERPDEKYDECVRETSYMRFHHMDLLAEIRDQVVREGVRGELGLSKCRECHPNRAQFCNRCHNAVNLYPDCFGCHYYPETPDTPSGEGHDG